MAKKPQIRFKGHQDEWGDKKLGDIYNFLKGKGLSKEKLTYKGKNKCILYGEIFTRYNFEIADCISSTDFNEGIPSVAGDIIMPGSTTTDGIDLAKAVHIPENNILYGGDIIVLRPKDVREVNPYFQSTLLSSINREQIAAVAQGITIVHLHGSDLDAMHYLMPEVKEQQKIGEFFKTLDELICAKEEELEKLRQLKAALLEQMFPSEGDKHEAGGGNSQIISLIHDSELTVSTVPNTPRIRFKGFTEPWKKKTFGKYGYISMCKRVMKYQTLTKGEIPFFKIGTFGGQPDAYISRELFENLRTNYQYPHDGDILISAAGTLGRAVEFDGKEQYFQDSNIVWLNHKGKLYNPFLKLLYGVVTWNSVEGSTLKRLYNSNILNTEIFVPSYQEQQKIGDFFREQDDAINAADQQIRKLKTIKRALMDKMFA